MTQCQGRMKEGVSLSGRNWDIRRIRETSEEQPLPQRERKKKRKQIDRREKGTGKQRSRRVQAGCIVQADRASRESALAFSSLFPPSSSPTLSPFRRSRPPILHGPFGSSSIRRLCRLAATTTRSSHVSTDRLFQSALFPRQRRVFPLRKLFLAETEARKQPSDRKPHVAVFHAALSFLS